MKLFQKPITRAESETIASGFAAGYNLLTKFDTDERIVNDYVLDSIASKEAGVLPKFDLKRDSARLHGTYASTFTLDIFPDFDIV